MAYPQGINFRATSGYVTDGANDTYEIATAIDYPRTTAQGNTVGWESAIGGNTRDRTTSNDARLCGIHFTQTAQKDFRFDLPSAGNYNIRIAAGDAAANFDTQWSLVDGTTSLGNLTTGTNGATNSFKDATDTAHTAVNWPSSNTAVTKTFATTICRFRSNSAASLNVIAHAYVEAAASGVTLSPGTSALSLSGSLAPTVTQSNGVTLSPGVASLALTGFAPSMAQGRTLMPGTAAQLFSALSPSITQATNLAPGTASLLRTSYAPVVTQVYPVTLNPGSAQLVFIVTSPIVQQLHLAPAYPLNPDVLQPTQVVGSPDENFYCDLCGRKDLRANSEKTWDGFRVCKRHKEQRNPLDFQRAPRAEQPLPWYTPKPPEIAAPAIIDL